MLRNTTTPPPTTGHLPLPTLPEESVASSSTPSRLPAPERALTTTTEAGRRWTSSNMELAIRGTLSSMVRGTPEVEEYEMADLGALRLPQHRHPDNHIRTSDGAGFALSNGRVLRWSNGSGSWDRQRERDIVSIRLGADGHGYACTADNKLLCLTGPRAGRAAELTASPVFAASPTGHIASLVGDGEHGPQTIRLTEPHGDDEPAVHTTLRVPPSIGTVRALAYANDGNLHLLTDSGEVWLTHPDTAGGDGQTWTPVPTPPGVTFTSLYTFAKPAEVGACDARGANQYLLEKNHTWTPRPDATATGLQKIYGQYRDSQQKFTNVTLGSPFTPGAARSDRVGTSWWQSKMAVLSKEVTTQLVPRGAAQLADAGVTAERLGRYLNYFMAHYLPGPSLPAQEKPAPDKQLREEFDALAKLPDTTAPRVPLDPAINEAMHTNAAMALDRLERALGITDADGNRIANERDSQAVRAAQHERANTPDNMLYVLLERRKKFLPADGAGVDPVAAETTRRLERLVNAGVHLQRPLAPHAPRSAHGFLAYPALAVNSVSDAVKSTRQPATQGLDILVGKLVHDQLCYERAAQRPATTATDVAADLDRLTGEDGNLVSRRFAQGIWDARAEAVFHTMRQILGGFGQEHHVLNRAARFQGVLGKDHAADHVRMVNELAPGDSKKFEYTVQVGVDGDGWSHNWTPADRFKEGAHPDVKSPADLKGRFNIPMNKVPNILPVPTASVSHTRAMTVTKRTDGVDLTFTNAYDAEVKLLAAKIKWGAGEYGANKRMTPDGKESRSVLGLVFFGVETVASAMTFSIGSDNSIRVSLNNDERGTVDHLLHQILSGQLKAEELLDAAATLSYTRRQHRKWSNTLDVQALMAAVAIFTPKLKLDERLKLVVAFVEQWTASLTSSKEHSRTQDANGVTFSARGADMMASLNRKFISVTEIQGSWLKALPAFSTMIGKTKDIIIGDGYEMEHKVPTWIDLQIMELFAPKALYKTPSVQEQADGTITGMNYSLSTKEALDFTALPHWDEIKRHSPQIAENLEAAAQAARERGLAVSVEMELIPERLELLNAARPLDNKPLDPAMAADLSKLVQSADSWRPARLSVTGSAQFSTALVAGLTAGRYRSHASATHISNLALIEIAYDDSTGAPATPLRATVRGPLTKGGGQPQFEQLDALVEPATAELVYGVLDERRDGPRRKLAALPPTGADAAGLAQLAGELLQRPVTDDAPHLLLVNGNPTLQFREEDGGLLRHVTLNEEECQRLLARRSEAVDTAGLLQLMHAGASGTLKLDVGEFASLARRERSIAREGFVRVATGTPSTEPLALGALLADPQRLEGLARRGQLNMAQRMVLATFFPGEHSAARAVEVAEDRDVSTALIQSVSQATDEALAESAPHDTPETHVRTDGPAGSRMMPSGAMASASASATA